MSKDYKNLIVLSSPSGGGKTTVSRHLRSLYPDMEFSISATTRAKRPNETFGVDYYYLSREEFEGKIKAGELAEYEEIFGNYYGTLKAEIDKKLEAGYILLFDIDVKGAFSLKKAYPDNTLLIFLAPLNEEVLEKRLRGRSTETEEQIQTRLSRAKMEIEQSKGFDYVIINDTLEQTFKEIEEIAARHLTK